MLATFACGKVVGTGEVGAACGPATACKNGLTCAFERCRTPCTTRADCSGTRCVNGESSGYVCQLEDEKLQQGVACTRISDCAGGQVCASDAICRDRCTTANDCATGSVCTDGACAKAVELVDGGLPSEDGGPPATRCIQTRDCAQDLVCLGGECKEECVRNIDCPKGHVCEPARPDGPRRCALP